MRKLDYALLCCDGIYNMGPEEAATCAEIIGAKHNIPIHMKPGALFDRRIAEGWGAPGKMVLGDGEEAELLNFSLLH
jgi:L-ascorbate metabolism protein UlaG (beta-lactamase superfamily)